MKFGIREICDVVMKAKTPMKIGNKVFYKDEPVLYFDTLKTSTLEGASTTVYATGGRGNTRLIAWDGERTVTFTMEDALISAEGLMILTGAGLVEASGTHSLKQHVIETTNDVEPVKGTGDKFESVYVYVENKPYADMTKDSDGKDVLANNTNYTYIMVVKDGEPVTEPFLPSQKFEPVAMTEEGKWAVIEGEGAANKAEKWRITIPGNDLIIDGNQETYEINTTSDLAIFKDATVLVDYYTERTTNTKQIEITAESFGGNFYLEASTLFRNQDGADLPAEFIIPNCKVQSNFTFNMASSGDPSTFTFTLDAFPGYTRFDPTKKVLAVIQVIEDATSENAYRTMTVHDAVHDNYFK